jgi:hypothetical protein
VDGDPPSTLYNLLSGIMEWTGIPNPQGSSVTESGEGLPQRFAVLTPYPNPFNAITTVPIALHHSGRVQVETFDILGRRVNSRTISMRAGRHNLSVEMPVNSASGLYFLRVGFGDEVRTRSILLVK